MSSISRAPLQAESLETRVSLGCVGSAISKHYVLLIAKMFLRASSCSRAKSSVLCIVIRLLVGLGCAVSIYKEAAYYPCIGRTVKPLSNAVLLPFPQVTKYQYCTTDHELPYVIPLCEAIHYDYQIALHVCLSYPDLRQYGLTW